MRSLRAAALLAATSVALFVACGTAAARSSQPGASCGSGSSAVNQYCENIPSANGHGTPAPGQPQTGPQLGSSLPPAATHALRHASARQRKRAHNLLLLSAPAHVSASLGGQGGGLGVPVGVIIALVVVAATGAVAVYARSRQGRAG